MTLAILAYVAGALTILSPCILPVLPFVFAKSQGSFAKNGLPLLLGMALAFSLFSGLAIAGGEWIGSANEAGRYLALALMGFFGLSLIFPHLSEAALAPLARFGSKLGSQSRGNGFGGAFVLGIGTGLLWAPCAGPILGLVLTGAASRGSLGMSFALLLSYSLGAATSLAVALLAGNRFFQKLKGYLGVDRIVRRVLGTAVLVGVAAIAFGLDRSALTQVAKIQTEAIESRLLSLSGLGAREGDSGKKEGGAPGRGARGELPIEGPMPELSGAVAWLNSKPLAVEELRGKVVLVDFWTYSCINCLRTLPYVKSWYAKYKDAGLVVIGVHTPEFAFEKNPANVQKAVSDLAIGYPVAIDADYKIWNAFQNQYWPAHYFADRLGRIRHRHFGEGEYAESEEIIRTLLAEGGRPLDPLGEAPAAGLGALAASSRGDVRSPETYVGYARSKNFAAASEIARDAAFDYGTPPSLGLNQWSLGGKWVVGPERAVSGARGARVAFKFHARDLHLVLGAGSQRIAFQARIDGHSPGKDRGVDLDEGGRGAIDAHRLYQLIRQTPESAKLDHDFEIEFSSPGAEVYAFTFG